MTRVSCALCIVLVAGILMATPARAQSTGAIQGNIVDAQGAVVPGVTVTVKNVATGVERTTVSDAGGDYLTPSLAPGLYRIETRLTGFGDQSRDIEVEVARTSVVNIRLTVGPVAESVSVVGASPVIETATTSVGQVISQRTVQEIPLNGRHFVDLGLLIPGSVTPPQNGFLTAPLRGQGSFAFNTAGNREDTVNFMINGVNLNDPAQNQITFQPSINTVSEFKVDNSTFSAEYGRNSGAIVNIATRSGANDFHGEVFEFFRDDALDSRNYLQSPAGAAVAVQAQPVRRQLRRADHQEPDVLLRHLRRPPAAAGHRHQQRRAARRSARRRHRSGVAEPAAAHPDGQRHRRQRRRPLPRVRHRPGGHRSVDGRRPPQRRATTTRCTGTTRSSATCAASRRCSSTPFPGSATRVIRTGRS